MKADNLVDLVPSCPMVKTCTGLVARPPGHKATTSGEQLTGKRLAPEGTLQTLASTGIKVSSGALQVQCLQVRGHHSVQVTRCHNTSSPRVWSDHSDPGAEHVAHYIKKKQTKSLLRGRRCVGSVLLRQTLANPISGVPTQAQSKPRQTGLAYGQPVGATERQGEGTQLWISHVQGRSSCRRQTFLQPL